MNHPIPRHLQQIWWSWGKNGVFLPRDEGAPRTDDAEAWRRMHPDYTYTLWRRDASFAFIDQQPAHRRAQFHAYTRHIQRCDMFRILVLQQQGGIYADIDLIPRLHLDKLWECYPQAGLILSTETVLTAEYAAMTASYPVRQGIPEHPVRIANYWLAARPGHPLLQEMLDLMQARANLPVLQQYDVLYTTGPDIVTTVVHQNSHAFADVVVLDPATSAQWMVHEHRGSWRKHGLA